MSSPVERMVAMARSLLDMDAALLSTFEDDRWSVRALDGDGAAFGLQLGSTFPLSETYCGRVVEGSLPSVVPETDAEPAARELAATRAAGIGAYVGVPVRRWDGSVYGTLCCLSRTPDRSLNERDGRFLGGLAQLIADELDRRELESEKRRVETDRIRGVLGRRSLGMAFQPVFELREGRLVSFEALARFPPPPSRGPSEWFAEAAAVGLGVQLELAAIETALARLDELPSGVSLSLNVSPETALTPRFAELVRDVAQRLVLEITEHARVESYEALQDALAPLRSRGARLAVDDVGAGFASLRHILRLDPDIVKLDLSLTQRIAADPARASLASSLVDFARGIGAAIAAEGIETEEELDFLRGLGVGYGQGFHLGRPGPLH